MSETLQSRETCARTIQAVVSDDGFMARWGLLLAMEMLDLSRLNDLAQLIADSGTDVRTSNRRRAQALADERWHPSRLG